MNFSSYRELQLNTERAQLFNQVGNLPFMSKRLALQKYMGLSDNEMKQNEELWREENDYQKYQDNEKAAALKNIGIRPEPNEMVDLDAEPDLSGLETDLGGEDINTSYRQYSSTSRRRGFSIMKINEFYEPSNDKEAMRSEDDTRKSKLTLKELNKLRKVREISRAEEDRTYKICESYV